MSDGTLLFLDLARKFGWAEGRPGERPIFGHGEFAPVGSTPAAQLGGCLQWIGTRLQAFRPKTIIYEAFLDPRFMGGKTNLETTFVLLGLPAVVEAVANRMGVHDVRKARVGDVRFGLLGRRIPGGDPGKKIVRGHLRELGYEVDSLDAADALAGWLFSSMVIAPDRPVIPMPLFEAATKVKRAKRATAG